MAKNVKIKFTGQDDASHVVNKVSSNIKKLDDGIRNTSKGISDTTKNMKNSFNSMIAPIVAVTAAVGAAIYGIKKMSDASIKLADDTRKLSLQTGLTTDEVQKWDFVARMNKTSIDKLSGGFADLAEKAYMAAKGAGEEREIFDALNVSVVDSSGKLKDHNKIIEETIMALADETDATKQAAMAKKLLGGAGDEIIPSLRLGSKALRQQKEDAQKLGQVMSGATMKALEDFNDKVSQLGRRATVAAGEIFAPFIPSIYELAKALQPAAEKLTDILFGMAQYFKMSNMTPEQIEIEKNIALLAKDEARYERVKAIEEERKKETERLERLGLAIEKAKIEQDKYNDVYESLIKLKEEGKKYSEGELIASENKIQGLKKEIAQYYLLKNVPGATFESTLDGAPAGKKPTKTGLSPEEEAARLAAALAAQKRAYADYVSSVKAMEQDLLSTQERISETNIRLRLNEFEKSKAIYMDLYSDQISTEEKTTDTLDNIRNKSLADYRSVVQQQTDFLISITEKERSERAKEIQDSYNEELEFLNKYVSDVVERQSKIKEAKERERKASYENSREYSLLEIEIDRATQNEIINLEKSTKNEIDAIKKNYIDEYKSMMKEYDQINNTSYADDVIRAREASAEKMEVFEKMKAAGAITGEEHKEIELENQKALDIELDNLEQENLERSMAREDELLQKKLDTLDKWFSAASQVWGQVGQIIQTYTQTEMEKVDEVFDKKRDKAKSTIRNQKELDKELTRIDKEAEKKRKEMAKRGKQIALVEAIINTAQAVTRQFKDWPMPAAAVWAVITGALGAVQIGLIASQAFAKGGVVKSQPGVPSTGDQITARVNPNELILNTEQQANLLYKLSTTRGDRSSGFVFGDTYVVIEGNADEEAVRRGINKSREDQMYEMRQLMLDMKYRGMMVAA